LDPQACLAQLERDPQGQDERTAALRYVAALYLWRCKRLQCRGATVDPQGRRCLQFVDRHSGRSYAVDDLPLPPEQLAALQQELARLGNEPKYGQQ
jgi:hypothetical protein